MIRGGGGAQKKKSPHFRSSEVGISAMVKQPKNNDLVILFKFCFIPVVHFNPWPTRRVACQSATFSGSNTK